MTNEEKDKKEYELAVLLLREEDLSGVLSLLTEHHAEITSEARAKRLAFAYEINKHKEGVFATITFKAFGDEVKELEHALGLRAEVLRSLVVKTPKTSSRPAAVGTSSLAGDRAPRAASASSEQRSSTPKSLSNEALEKKLEEILS